MQRPYDKDYHRAYYQRNKEKISAHQKTKRAHINKTRKERHKANPELNRAYDRAQYAANPEKKKSRSRARYYGDIERARAEKRAYYAEHKEEIAAYQREYNRTHPGKTTIQSQKRRAWKAKAQRNDLTREQWLHIQEAQDHRCVYCGKRRKGKLSQDHITPLSKGGSHTLHNVVGACRSCNSHKHAGPPLSPVQPLLL